MCRIKKFKDVLNCDNKICKLGGVYFTKDEEVIRIEFEMIKVNSYSRRESKKQYEFHKLDCVAIIDQPTKIDSTQVINFIEKNWMDYVLEIIRNSEVGEEGYYPPYYSFPKFKMEKNQIYTNGGLVKSFKELCKTFRAIAMQYDIQPSQLDFLCVSGYANENSKIHYNYQKYLEDMGNEEE